MVVNTRDRLIRTAARLFRERGVTGTGILTVLAEAQAPRGSLYHHFPGGKEQLTVEALHYESDRVSQALRAVLTDDVDEAAALALFAEALASDLERSGFRLGCPVSTATLELASDDEAVRAVCASTYETWTRLLADHLVRLGRPEGPARDRAELVLCAFEGALLLARASKDGDVLRRTARGLAPHRDEDRPHF